MNPAGKLLTAALLALLGAGLVQCVHRELPEPAVVIVSIDGGAEPGEDPTSPCGRACSSLRALGCPEGAPSPAGVSCYDVCRSASAMLDATCVGRAKARSELATCGVRCVP